MSEVGSWWKRWRPTFGQLVLVTFVGLVLSIGAHALGQDFGAITSALSDANTEVRGSVFPAVSAILGAIVLIAVAAGVVHVITRGK